MATPMMPGLLGGLNEEEIRNQALGSAALQAGLAGLMASGPSLSPVSTGQVLGQAGSVGLGAYQQGLQQAQQQQMQRQAQQTIQGVLGGQGADGGKMDMGALADKYAQLGVAFSAADPQRAKFYFDAAKDLKEKVEKLSGSAANIAYGMWGTADAKKLSPEQIQAVLAREQEQKMSVASKQAPVMPAINIKYGEGFGTKLASAQVGMIEASQASAQGAADTLSTVSSMLPVLDESFTGPGSNIQVGLARIGQKIGVGGKSQVETLQNTAQLIKGAAQLELDAAAKMRGQGTITENERKLLQRAASVDPTELTQPEIRQVLGIVQKSSSSRISQHNKLLDKFIETQPEMERQLQLYRVSPPVPVRRVP